MENPEVNSVLPMEGVLLALTVSVISAGQSSASTGLPGKSHLQIPERKWTDCQFHVYSGWFSLSFLYSYQVWDVADFLIYIWSSWWPPKKKPTGEFQILATGQDLPGRITLIGFKDKERSLRKAVIIAEAFNVYNLAIDVSARKWVTCSLNVLEWGNSFNSCDGFFP